MKQIGAKSTSGPEAILIAAIKYWMKPQLIPFQTKIRTIARDHMNDFNSKSEVILGKKLSKYIQMNIIFDDFWNKTKANHVLKFIVEEAVKNRKGHNLQENISWAQEFVENAIISEFGSWIKSEILT